MSYCKILEIFVIVAVGILLIYAAQDMPDYGKLDAPIQTHVAPKYIWQSVGGSNFSDFGDHIPNMVTGILAYYRGYDTLGETAVVFTAAASVILLLRSNRRRKS